MVDAQELCPVQTAAMTFRKNDELEELLAMSSDVATSPPVICRAATAREAARALVGLVGWISQRSGAQAMQAAMVALASHNEAWDPSRGPLFRSLPAVNGQTDVNVAMIATILSGLVPQFGVRALRSACAFWATEADPAVWQAVASP